MNKSISAQLLFATATGTLMIGLSLLSGCTGDSGGNGTTGPGANAQSTVYVPTAQSCSQALPQTAWGQYQNSGFQPYQNQTYPNQRTGGLQGRRDDDQDRGYDNGQYDGRDDGQDDGRDDGRDERGRGRDGRRGDHLGRQDYVGSVLPSQGFCGCGAGFQPVCDPASGGLTCAPAQALQGQNLALYGYNQNNNGFGFRYGNYNQRGGQYQQNCATEFGQTCTVGSFSCGNGFCKPLDNSTVGICVQNYAPQY
jgi:hypothetical protein